MSTTRPPEVVALEALHASRTTDGKAYAYTQAVAGKLEGEWHHMCPGCGADFTLAPNGTSALAPRCKGNPPCEPSYIRGMLAVAPPAPTAAAKPSASPASSGHLLNGAEFILDAPQEVPAVWGTGGQVLWAAGEPLYIVGPAGVGKTTLAQNIALRRHGIGDPELLGFPVAVDERAVLYVAADRPSQAARSFARMVGEKDRQALEWFKVHRGPLPFGDLAKDPELLTPWLESLDVGTVIFDSLKDVALGLSEDAPAAAVNLALQRTVAAGIEVAVLHHQRKATGDNKRPRTLSDVYGSTWITAGAGSVLLLWGEAGDAIVELRHLKQPAEDVGPLKLIHDAPAGRVTVHEPTDLYALVQGAATRGGLTVREAASALFGSTDLDDNQIEKARRRLEALAAEGKAGKQTNGPGGVVRYLQIDVRAAA